MRDEPRETVPGGQPAIASTHPAGANGRAGACCHEKWMCALAPACSGSPWPG
jgi:hypothetical protein